MRYSREAGCKPQIGREQRKEKSHSAVSKCSIGREQGDIIINMGSRQNHEWKTQS